MRKLVKKLLIGTRFERPARRVQVKVRMLRRKALQVDEKLTQNYLATAKPWKLHLGCGAHPLPGWLNTDYESVLPEIVRLDVSGRFPYANDTFDYVFSEHMIEHIPFHAGQNMLNESFRVLKPGGRVRITTPDLAFLVDLYRADKSDLQKRYIEWTSKAINHDVPYALDTFVINNFVRAYGHQFIYDEKALRGSFERAGFKNICRCELNQSSDPVFRDLENEEKIPPGFLKLESFTLEGIK